MLTRRNFIATLAATAAIGALAGPFAARAAPPTVEIVALPHSPVQSALKPVRDFLTTRGGRVQLGELDAESAEGAKRISKAGVKGHVPILLLINGSDRFKRADGTVVEFKDFPAKAGNPLGLNGTWTVADFEAAIAGALGAAEK